MIDREQAQTLVHPDLLPVRPPTGPGKKMRRTVVRKAKLVNVEATENLKELTIVEVPIEPGHNNRGILSDPSMPLRHYLGKVQESGEPVFAFPHEYEIPEGVSIPEAFYPLLSEEGFDNFLCAVGGCWEYSMMPLSERCQEHEVAWQNKWISYATRFRATDPRLRALAERNL